MSNLFSPFMAQNATCIYKINKEWRKKIDNNYFIGAVLMDLSFNDL